MIDDGLSEKDEYKALQIPRYYKRVTDEGYSVLKILYLTLDGKAPSYFNLFPQQINWNELLINREYLTNIQNWLKTCLTHLTDQNEIKQFIQYYSHALTYFLNDIQLAQELKDITSAYIEDGHIKHVQSFWTQNTHIEGINFAQEIQDQFIHIKWHTVYGFYSLLRAELTSIPNVLVSEIDTSKITSVTHKGSRRIKTMITFTKEGILYYICNDNKGFSIGRHEEQEKKYKPIFDKSYANFDFKNEEVFKLISKQKSKELVCKIMSELKEFIK